jgi:hypothetical protein
MAHLVRGHDDTAAEWRGLLDQLLGDHSAPPVYATMFDAIVALDRDDAGRALALLQSIADPEPSWYARLFVQWTAALTAEAAILANSADAPDTIRRADQSTIGNHIAQAIVDRASAINSNDPPAFARIAKTFEAAGCPYQAQRTIRLASHDTLRN